MSKKILNVIIVISLLVMFSIYIGAEENSSYLNYSNEGDNLETSLSPPNSINLSLEENILPASNESNETNIPFNDSLKEINESLIIESDSTPNEISNSQTSSSENHNSEDVEYTNLDDIIQETEENISEEIIEKKKDVCLLHDSLGKKVIEIEDCNEENILGIGVHELEKNEFEKEVIISSQEHFDRSLRFYTSLTIESKREEIKIYWKNNENLEITSLSDYSVEYYDKDNNGLIDGISWIIPHLSEQIFEIKIEIEILENSSENILLNVVGPEGQTRNPIKFDINIDYSGDFYCDLEVGGNWTYNFSSNKTYVLNLPNGGYNWGVVCFDSTNLSIINATSGNFSINEQFSSNLQEGKLYLLNLVENKIKNPENITINSTSPSNFTIKIIRNGQIIYSKNTFNNTTIIMNESILSSSGIYSLSVKFGEPSPLYEILQNFSVASANLTFNTTQIQEGQSVKITASLNSPLEGISYTIFDYGNGTISNTGAEANPFLKHFTAKYTNKGTYNAKLTSYIGGTAFEIQRNGIVVTEIPNEKDNDEPTITLIEPDHKETIYGPNINFSYKANDNIKIQNCTFKLYDNCASLDLCITSSSNLIFPTNTQQSKIANNDSVKNNKEMEVKLQDFEEGFYEWIIECYDNSSNYELEFRSFRVSLNQTTASELQEYDQQEEVNELKERADDFLTTSFSLEEKEVLEDLNILNDTKYYKKRLLDIEEFFQENYKYVSSETLREKKTNEYLAELESIKNKIPQSITIIESYEYIKNSVDKDFESIVEEYFASTNTQIGKASINKLANANREIQNEISVSAKVKNVEIEYDNGTQVMTLIKKKVSINNDSYERILEIIPKDIVEDAEDIFFITKNKIINEDPIFEIKYEDLEKDEIIYYINSKVKLKDLEKTETVLFEEDLTKFETRFTGFFVFDSLSSGYTLYFALAIVLLLVLLGVVPLVFRKFRILSWKREPNVVRMINLIEDIKRLLREREVEKAREAYYKLKEIYPVLPYKTKAYFYEKINEVLIKIDKKDIFGLVKEYQDAKKRWNKEDYMRLYEDIKKIYKRLPEKDRKKVYDIINGY